MFVCKLVATKKYGMFEKILSRVTQNKKNKTGSNMRNQEACWSFFEKCHLNLTMGAAVSTYAKLDDFICE